MKERIRTWMMVMAAAAVSLCLAAQARAAVEGSFDRTLKVTGPVDLDVQTGAGNIEVRPGAAGAVHIRARIRASENWRGNSGDAEKKVHELETHPPIDQDGNTIRIGHIDDPELRRNISISYDVEVPAETRLSARSGSGNVAVSGIRGPLKAGSGSGNLKISNIGDEADIETGSGEVEAESIKGSARIRTGSGSIVGRGIGGGISASSGSGNVRLEQTAPGDVKVDTGSGGAEVNGVHGGVQIRAGSGNISVSGDPTNEWSLRSGSGTLTVHLLSQVGFDLDAHTSSGQIITDQPVTVQGTISHGHMTGKARGGGVRLSLETGSGNIHIE